MHDAICARPRVTFEVHPETQNITSLADYNSAKHLTSAPNPGVNANSIKIWKYGSPQPIDLEMAICCTQIIACLVDASHANTLPTCETITSVFYTCVLFIFVKLCERYWPVYMKF